MPPGPSFRSYVEVASRVAPLALDALLHLAHGAQRGGRDRAPPHEGRDAPDQRVGGGRGTGHGTQADQRLALPLGAEALVVGERGIDGVGEGSRLSLGAQLEIHPIAEAEGAAALEAGAHGAHQPRDRAVALEVRLERRRSLVDEQHVDVGGEVQLAPAELAEGQQGGRIDARLCGRAGESSRETGVRQDRELAEALAERPAPEVAGRDPQQSAVLRLADRLPVRSDRRRVRGRRPRPGCRREIV